MNTQKSINSMSEAGKLAKREYAKRWRAKNREKVRQYNYGTLQACAAARRFGASINAASAASRLFTRPDLPAITLHLPSPRAQAPPCTL